MPELIEAVQIIQNADAVLITAGAGMSVDSGLPDFRGKSGLWTAHPVARERGLKFEDLANPRWFDEDPVLAWAFYGQRLQQYQETVPHAGYGHLLDLAKKKPGGYFVFTSNVDGAFTKAGYDPQRICEVHGSIHHLQCTIPCTGRIWSADNLVVKIDLDKYEAVGELPMCPACGELARPNILMFGDLCWLNSRTNDQKARLNEWLNEQTQEKTKLVIIELGAGAVVPTVRYQSEDVLNATQGSRLIRVNPDLNDVPSGSVSIKLSAAEFISSLIELTE
ncbi:MAG: NAD-dependent deacetylase [Gammaproteobacteria bacterium]|nr:NAD-dependent deacetylase [Gammaproteobacteria bacterium]